MTALPQPTTREYPALVERIVDGDTVVLYVDQGLDGYRRLRIRLADIDAPDKTDQPEAAEQATAALRQLVEGRPVIVQTIKTRAGSERRERYGRYLARLALPDIGDVGTWLVGQCHATPYNNQR